MLSLALGSLFLQSFWSYPNSHPRSGGQKRHRIPDPQHWIDEEFKSIFSLKGLPNSLLIQSFSIPDPGFEKHWVPDPQHCYLRDCVTRWLNCEHRWFEFCDYSAVKRLNANFYKTANSENAYWTLLIERIPAFRYLPMVLAIVPRVVCDPEKISRDMPVTCTSTPEWIFPASNEGGRLEKIDQWQTRNSAFGTKCKFFSIFIEARKIC